MVRESLFEHPFIKQVFERAREIKPKIAFDEILDERVAKAIREIKELGIAEPIMVNYRNIIQQAIEKYHLNDIDYFSMDNKAENFANELYNIRKNKLNSVQDAKKLLEKSNYFSTMLVYMGIVDAYISGATHTTAETIRPALQIIKTREPFTIASGVFFMLPPKPIYGKEIFLFADSAIIPNPDSKQLAEIAIQTGLTAKAFGINPKIALLSFSTYGSAKHELVDKVKDAVEIAKQLNEKYNFNLEIDGELQLDAAIVPDVGKRKAPNSKIAGNANVLIFPDLNAGNIGYKLVERFGNVLAIGPMLQGLKKPVNDLSRGCKVEDIVVLAAITALQTQQD